MIFMDILRFLGSCLNTVTRDKCSSIGFTSSKTKWKFPTVTGILATPKWYGWWKTILHLWFLAVISLLCTQLHMPDEQLLGTGRNLETMISTHREMKSYCGCDLLPFTLLLKREVETQSCFATLILIATMETRWCAPSQHPTRVLPWDTRSIPSVVLLVSILDSQHLQDLEQGKSICLDHDDAHNFQTHKNKKHVGI